MDHVTEEVASESLETEQMLFPIRGNMMNKADRGEIVGNEMTKKRWLVCKWCLRMSILWGGVVILCPLRVFEFIFISIRDCSNFGQRY